MSTIGATNRVIDTRKMAFFELKKQVRIYEAKKVSRSKRAFTAFKAPAICSQCKHNMRKDIADAQIENKRENAPICMSCIMGYKRKKPEKYDKHWKSETKEQFKAYCKKYYKNKKNNNNSNNYEKVR